MLYTLYHRLNICFPYTISASFALLSFEEQVMMIDPEVVPHIRCVIADTKNFITSSTLCSSIIVCFFKI